MTTRERAEKAAMKILRIGGTDLPHLETSISVVALENILKEAESEGWKRGMGDGAKLVANIEGWADEYYDKVVLPALRAAIEKKEKA